MIIPMNPIQEKDQKIAELEKIITEHNKAAAENNNLRELLTKTKAELSYVKKNSLVLNKKINFTNKVTEEQLLAALDNPNSLSENPHLVSVYSATLNEDDFELDEKQEIVKPIKEEFFKNLEEKINSADASQIDRLNILKNQVLEKVEVSKKAGKDPLVYRVFVVLVVKKEKMRSLLQDQSDPRQHQVYPLLKI